MTVASEKQKAYYERRRGVGRCLEIGRKISRTKDGTKFMSDEEFLELWGRPCRICGYIRPRRMVRGENESAPQYLDRRTCDNTCLSILRSMHSGQNMGMPMPQHQKDILREVRKKQIITEETRRKISIANIGHTYSAKTLEKMSKVKKGKKFTEEHKKNLSIARGTWKPSEKAKIKRSQKLTLAWQEGGARRIAHEKRKEKSISASSSLIHV